MALVNSDVSLGFMYPGSFVLKHWLVMI